MSVKEAIFHLEAMEKDPENALSPEDHQAINLVIVVLKTLTPQQEQLIDAVMTLEP